MNVRLCVLILCIVNFVNGLDIFVATTGSNTKGNGTIGNPFADALYAYNTARPGDTIYVRGGVYGAPDWNLGYWFSTRNGTEGNYITIQNYNNEKVVFDGNITLGKGETLFEFEHVQYIILDGFEIRNAQAQGACLWAAYAHDVIIRNCIIHDCSGTCGQFIGFNYTFENNEIYNCVLDNAYSNRTGGWAGSFGSGGMQPNGKPSSNYIFRNNYIHETWGEGLSTPNTENIEITNNVIINAFSASIYVDHSKNVNISNNFIDVNNKTYRRGDNGQIAHGIAFSCEYYYGAPEAPFGAWDVLVANNIIVRSNNGIFYWQDTRNKNWYANYQNLQIINNVVISPAASALYLDGPANSTVSIENNILEGGPSQVMAPKTGITTDNNDYPVGKPTFDTSNKTISADPQFVNSALAMEYNGSDISNPLKGLALQSSSPCKFAGVYVPNVLTDITGAPRPNPPSMGPIEYHAGMKSVVQSIQTHSISVV